MWTGDAQIYAGSDGTQLDRIRVTSGSNGAAVLNVEHLYGEAEGATAAEIITVTGSYPIPTGIRRAEGHRARLRR
ncbi:hypothetical protein ABZ078_05710 [Streptomyces sp. NPDC006385]|uniref:hypothetical protein n=1 Tax=Streptomyces sp. NPDC006385 TaxID=3156761 RepID=UPI0033A11BBE